MNCDGSVDIVDALLIAQLYVGLIDSFPCKIAPSHAYFHKNIMIAVNHSDEISCDDFSTKLIDELPVNWNELNVEIDTIKQMISCQDITKIAAIDTAATFIKEKWDVIRKKITDEIDKIFDQNRKDCHYFCFRQEKSVDGQTIYNYTTFMFLDVKKDIDDNDLFNREDFAFYVFVLALQLRAQNIKNTGLPSWYIDQINPDWILTVHNMIIGSPGGEAAEWAASTTPLGGFPYEFLVEDDDGISPASDFLDEIVGTPAPHPPDEVHVYILDTLPLIYDSSPEEMTVDEIDNINNTIDTLKDKINGMLQTDLSQPAKVLQDHLLPLEAENDLFKRIGSFPTCDSCCQQFTCCNNCNAGILVTDPDYNTPIPDHGIFIAGLIKSIAPDATIEILQTLNRDGVGSMKAFLCALNYIHKNMDTSKKNIINCSFGLKCSFQNPETVYEDMVAQYEAVYETVVAPLETLMNLFSDTTVIASTGNHDHDESTYPAALDLDHVIGIGSLGIEGIGDPTPVSYKIATYSNTTKIIMKNPDPNALNPIKVVTNGFYTPGGMIRNPKASFNDRETSDKKGLFGLYIGDEITEEPDHLPVYAYWCGTSFAAPLVAGVFANLYRKYDQDQVMDILKDLEDELVDKNPDNDEFFDLDPDKEIIAVPIIQQHMYDNKHVIIPKAEE